MPASLGASVRWVRGSARGSGPVVLAGCPASLSGPVRFSLLRPQPGSRMNEEHSAKMSQHGVLGGLPCSPPREAPRAGLGPPPPASRPCPHLARVRKAARRLGWVGRARPPGFWKRSGASGLRQRLLPAGEQALRESADPHGGHLRDPQVQLQAHRREPLRLRLGVSEPHADVRVPPAGVPRGRVLPEPVLHQAPVPRDQDHQDGRQRLGPGGQEGHQEGVCARARVRPQGSLAASSDLALPVVLLHSCENSISKTVFELLQLRIVKHSMKDIYQSETLKFLETCLQSEL